MEILQRFGATEIDASNAKQSPHDRRRTRLSRVRASLRRLAQTNSPGAAGAGRTKSKPKFSLLLDVAGDVVEQRAEVRANQTGTGNDRHALDTLYAPFSLRFGYEAPAE